MLDNLFSLYAVLEDGLKKNFRDASVSVVECPDLTVSPWSLSAPGMKQGVLLEVPPSWIPSNKFGMQVGGVHHLCILINVVLLL